MRKNFIVTVGMLLIGTVVFFSCATQEGYESAETGDEKVEFDFPPYEKTGEEPVVMVVPFENISMLDFDKLGDSVSSVFTTALVKSNRVKVVDRENLEQMIEEMKFSMSGLTETSKALEVGKMVNAKYLITGDVTEYSVTSEKRSAGCGVLSTSGSGMGGKVQTNDGTARMAIDLKMVNLETSVTEYADTLEGEYYTKDVQGGMAAFNAFAGAVAATGESAKDFGSTLVGKTARKAVYEGIQEMIRNNTF